MGLDNWPLLVKHPRTFLKHVRVSTSLQHGHLASAKACGDEKGSIFLGFEPLLQACCATSPYNRKGIEKLQRCVGSTRLDLKLLTFPIYEGILELGY